MVLVVRGYIAVNGVARDLRNMGFVVLSLEWFV